MEHTSLDQLYENLINAEAQEAAALLMLNASDDVAVRAQYEIAVEAVEEARGVYEAALNDSETRVAIASSKSA